MDCFLNNIQCFTLGNNVELNLWDCKIHFKGSDLSIDVSALQYERFEDAENLFRILCQINSSYVTKPLGIRKFGESQEEGIVIVEKMHPFSVWLNDKRKPDMWKIFGDNRTCIGVGYDFQIKFQQIMWGLEAIHKSSRRHGNLFDGVYIGTDGNIRLSNFYFFDDDIWSLKNDFRDFQKLVETATSRHPVPPTVNTQLVEVDQLNELFDHFLKPNHFKEQDASWLYAAPIIWNSSQKKAFFSRISNIFKADGSTRRLFHPQIQNWASKIKPNSSLYNTLNVLVLVSDSSSSQMKMNMWYGQTDGIAVFVRNFCEHNFILTDPFNEIELTFPGISGLIYNDLVTGPYFSADPDLSWYYPPPNCQILQVEGHNSYGGTQQNNIVLSMEVEKYLKQEKSIWG